MATPEKLSDHAHLDYGLCPNHRLDSGATARDLYDYVKAYNDNFSNGPHGHSIGKVNERDHEVRSKLTVSHGNRFYYLDFFVGGHIDRTYRVYPDRLELVLPRSGSSRYQEISQRTDGEHVWYITSHLRAAGVLAIPENQRPRH